MYFSIGWPRVINCNYKNIRKIVCDRVKILFTILTDDTLAIWYTKVRNGALSKLMQFPIAFFLFLPLLFLFPFFFLALRSDSSEGTKCGMFGKVRTKHHRRVETGLEHAAGGHGQRNPLHVHTDCERHAKGCVQPDRLTVLESAP